MSGGKMEMNYDHEHIYFKGNCIEYDVIDLFQMLVDCALEPRSVLAANVARSKNRKSHDLRKHLHKYDPFSDDLDLLMRTAYGYNTLGMPLMGMEHNLDNIDARMLQQYIMDNITPEKCVIVASGVRNHKEFVDLVKERIGEILPVPEHQYDRQPAEYIGGEARTWTESPNTSILLAFEADSWKSEDVAAYFIMNSFLGGSKGDAHVSGGQHSRNLNTSLLQKHPFVDHVHSIQSHFTDSGIFGLHIEGHGSHSQELMSLALE
jgi:predicted Zn-dependent peptidase